MVRSRVVSLLAVVGLAPAAVLSGSGAATADPPLSEGCANLHQFDGNDGVLASSGVVFIDPRVFDAGEQVRFVGHSDSGGPVRVTVGSPGGQRNIDAASDELIRIDVPATTAYYFVLTPMSGGTTSWHPGCGLPPAPAITSPTDGQTFTIGQSVPAVFNCSARTNPLASCVDGSGAGDGSGVLDTSTSGPHAYTVTATDTRGLRSATSISYTVVKKAQSIAFTSTPPDGSVDWFFGDLSDVSGGLGYVAAATATSGLPVTYSLDPASEGICRIAGILDDNPILGSGAGIQFLGAGTCTIHADQPGNDEYRSADRVSQSFEIAKVQTGLTAAKAGKGVLGLTPSTFSATLWVPVYAGGGGWSSEGYAGQSVTFSVDGRTMCTATTNASGVATCKAPIGLASWTSQSSYTATYAGDANYLGASATGKLGG